MSDFDESQHRRGQPNNRGQFAPKGNTAPADELREGPGPLVIEILETPHPQGGYNARIMAPTGEHFLLDGAPHRDDGAAYLGHDGSEYHYSHGVLHRNPEDGPAVYEERFDINQEGIEEFYLEGNLISTVT